MEDNINKYYTPEIKEFHVGFEFEYMSVETNGWVSIDKDMWLRPKGAEETHLLRSVNEWDRCIKHADLTKVRVKYLDREDIESLGWIYILDEVNYYKLNNFKLYYFGNTFISIDKTDHSKYNYVAAYQYFRGTIKNKSELIKLMKQLNVC